MIPGFSGSRDTSRRSLPAPPPPPQALPPPPPIAPPSPPRPPSPAKRRGKLTPEECAEARAARREARPNPSKDVREGVSRATFKATGERLDPASSSQGEPQRVRRVEHDATAARFIAEAQEKKRLDAERARQAAEDPSGWSLMCHDDAEKFVKSPASMEVEASTSAPTVEAHEESALAAAISESIND